MSLPKPELQSKHWIVPNRTDIRVSLTERPGVNIYTSVERHEGTRANGYEWAHVKHSARGHGDSVDLAEARVARLLDGGWRNCLVEAGE